MFILKFISFAFLFACMATGVAHFLFVVVQAFLPPAVSNLMMIINFEVGYFIYLSDVLGAMFGLACAYCILVVKG